MERVLVIGLGVSGRAAMQLLKARGVLVEGYDDLSAPTPPQGAYDLLVLSPGIPLSHPLLERLHHVERIGEVELALRLMGKEKRAVAITGTNGKSTASALLAHALQERGMSAVACGNFGLPLSKAIEDSSDILVVELSSWQLETMSSAKFSAGAILNLSPDHLDRHGSMREYGLAKLRLQHCLLPGAPFYLHSSVVEEVASSVTRPFTQPQDPVQEMAALFGITKEQFAASCTTFQPLPHRMQLVLERGGVTYYNDSKGTNLEAVRYALPRVGRPLHLILGGVHKGGDFSTIKEDLKKYVCAVYTIGEAADVIAKQVAEAVPCSQCGTLESAVYSLQKRVQPGEAVLLSPGCASLDQFSNYKERGERFCQLIGERVS